MPDLFEDMEETTPPVDQSLLLYSHYLPRINGKTALASDLDPGLVGRFLHPMVYYAYMQMKFGDEWKDFEPEIVREMFRSTIPKDDDIMDIHGAWSVIAAHGGGIGYEVFENICLAFNGVTPSRLWHQPMTLEQMCHALDVIQSVYQLDWSDEVKVYIDGKCDFSDFEVIRPEYEFIRGVVENSKVVFEYDYIPEDSQYEQINASINKYKDNQLGVFLEFMDNINLPSDIPPVHTIIDTNSAS